MVKENPYIFSRVANFNRFGVKTGDKVLRTDKCSEVKYLNVIFCEV